MPSAPARLSIERLLCKDAERSEVALRTKDSLPAAFDAIFLALLLSASLLTSWFWMMMLDQLGLVRLILLHGHPLFRAAAWLAVCAAGLLTLQSAALILMRFNLFHVRLNPDMRRRRFSWDVLEGLLVLRFWLYGALAGWMGWDAPLERRVRELEGLCSRTFGSWLGRLVRRRFFDALRRHSIGCHAAVLLLEDLLSPSASAASAADDNAAPPPCRRCWRWRQPRHRNQKMWQPDRARAEAAPATQPDGPTVVVLPGTRAQQEAFLDLPVTEDTHADAEAAAASAMLAGAVGEAVEPLGHEPPRYEPGSRLCWGGRPAGQQEAAAAAGSDDDCRARRRVADVLAKVGWEDVLHELGYALVRKKKHTTSSSGRA